MVSFFSSLSFSLSDSLQKRRCCPFRPAVPGCVSSCLSFFMYRVEITPFASHNLARTRQDAAKELPLVLIQRQGMLSGKLHVPPRGNLASQWLQLKFFLRFAVQRHNGAPPSSSLLRR